MVEAPRPRVRSAVVLAPMAVAVTVLRLRLRLRWLLWPSAQRRERRRRGPQELERESASVVLAAEPPLERLARPARQARLARLAPLGRRRGSAQPQQPRAQQQPPAAPRSPCAWVSSSAPTTAAATAPRESFKRVRSASRLDFGLVFSPHAVGRVWHVHAPALVRGRPPGRAGNAWEEQQRLQRLGGFCAPSVFCAAPKPTQNQKARQICDRWVAPLGPNAGCPL